MTLPSSSSLTPAIVRLAGISADFLAALVPEEDTAATQLPALREALSTVRRQVADTLYSEIPHHAPDVRRRLLDLRRCCHNGRSVVHRLDNVLQLDFQAKGLSSLLKNLADLELRAAEYEKTYAAEYETRRRHEIEVLASPLSDSPLRRGLALASPSFSGDIELLSRAAVKRSRPNQRLVNTLVRYITRSALKLSPYSTLTPVALAEVTPVSGQPVRFARGSRTTVSNLRIKRYLLDQCCELLRRLPFVRPHLDVYLNSTVRHVGENQYRFLRPPQLQESEDASSLTYSRYEQINIRLKGVLPAVLLSNLPQGSLGQLIRRLRVDLAYSESEDGALARAVDQLIEIGFLSLVFPVRSYDPHFEKALQSFLSTLPPDPLLTEIYPLIEEIVHLEESFSISADPAGTCVRVEQAVDELYQSLQSGLPAGVSARLQKNPEHNLYEDCFEVSLESAQGTVLQLDEDALRMALNAGNLAWQIASVRESRHELLLTLDAFMEKQFPGEESVPLLDLFERFRPLWEEYLSFLAEKTKTTFNPYNLSAVLELEGMRLDLERRLREILRTTEEVDSFPLPEFRRAVHEIPQR
jgi:Lantibiotic dehydratase, N terminus